MTEIVDELNNFKYPDHITQDQKDLHRIAKYKHHTLGFQIEMYEKAMTTMVQGKKGLVPLDLPPLNV